MAAEELLPPPAPLSRSPGLLLGTYDIKIKGRGAEITTGAHFFYNHQFLNPIWLETSPEAQKWPASADVEVIAPGVLQPFPASTGGISIVMQNGSPGFCLPIDPSRVPLESLPAGGLKSVTFGVLDSPLVKSITQSPQIIMHCAQFDVLVAEPSQAHLEIAKLLGSTPHNLNQSGTLYDPNGQLFSSDMAVAALSTIHEVLSFAAGRWIGMTLVDGLDPAGKRAWFRLGTTRMSEPTYAPNWFDPDHPEWLTNLCDGLLQLQADEQAADVMQSALYWYSRSNTRGGGIDGALILTQCALELLSWFVIVRRKRALSESGYGQLSNAAERLRLMLTLLGIPASLPRTLPKICALKEDWDDVPDAVVEARNYLVHPTQSRSGKRRQKKDLPWHELWVAGQWILELVILRLLGYQGNYQNRTRMCEFQRNEKVPWAR
jgi:hypothetical protein